MCLVYQDRLLCGEIDTWIKFIAVSFIVFSAVIISCSLSYEVSAEFSAADSGFAVFLV